LPGSFAYTPAAGEVLSAGTHALSLTFTPTDATNYANATATVSLNVTKATPTITWPTPADIVAGTALSATQLNATASVLGTFVYTPAAGTILNAGAAQTLSVTLRSPSRRRRRRRKTARRSRASRFRRRIRTTAQAYSTTAQRRLLTCRMPALK
jgi:hypothetical protein